LGVRQTLLRVADRADPGVVTCQELLRRGSPPIVPALVVAEAGFLVERDLGSADRGKP
jgi:hypothetical protein